MNLGIKSIGSYIPENFIDNLIEARKFNESKDFITNKIGALKLPRKSDNQDTSDLCVEAVKSLQKNSPELNLKNIDAIIVITQNGDNEGLPHTSAIVQRKLNLSKSIAAFDISLGCSGYVYGLYIMQGFLAASGLKNGILITSDPYSKVINQSDRVTSMLFGDAATATWIGENPILNLSSVLYGTDGEGEDHLKISNKTLHMNGRQVFNFAASHVAPHIKLAILNEGLNENDIDAYVLHQGSNAIIDAVSKRFNENSKFIKDIKKTGNTVSSSIPLILEEYVLHPENKWENIVLCGFGVGFSWATAILKRENL